MLLIGYGTCIYSRSGASGQSISCWYLCPNLCSVTPDVGIHLSISVWWYTVGNILLVNVGVSWNTSVWLIKCLLFVTDVDLTFYWWLLGTIDVPRVVHFTIDKRSVSSMECDSMLNEKFKPQKHGKDAGNICVLLVWYLFSIFLMLEVICIFVLDKVKWLSLEHCWDWL